MEKPEAQVIIKNHSFNPPEVEIKTGETVSWKNEDLTPHTVVSDPEGQAFKSNLIIWKGTFSHLLESPGEYPYHCSIHPNMHGKVTVQK